MKNLSCATLLMLTLTSYPCAADQKIDTGAIYEKARAASVEVLVGGRLDGSGWFADPEGYIVTAGHAVWHRDEKVSVSSATLGRIPVEVVAFDLGHDIALLKAPKRDTPYPHLEINEHVPAPGQPVYLFGSAMFRHEVMVSGSVARAEPTFEYLSDQGHFARVYHVSAPSPKGTSGGCWLDSEGRVIGNQSAFMSQDGHGTGIAMTAAPDAIARLVKTRQSAATPSLGTAFEELWTQPVGFIKRFPEGTSGLVPVLAVKDGPAEQAGLVGDIVITAVDGRPFRYRDTLLRHIRSKKAGDEVTLSILAPDGGEPREIKITLIALEQ
ncbi:MAG: PDZ domain-containing protein [Phycisphaera sp.]|nr:PDZ domain-containing protein [Phycisphaera sp.]